LDNLAGILVSSAVNPADTADRIPVVWIEQRTAGPLL